MQETWVQSLGWKDSMEKGMATHQYSCLENSMDRGVWQDTVHRAAKSLGHNWATNSSTTTYSLMFL